jgi:putative transposase
MPPAEMWAKSINLDDIPMPATPDLLRVILGRQHECKLTAKGVEYSGLFYNSDEMEELRKRHGFKISVTRSVDESNIGSLFVIYEGSIFKVPALKSDYAEGISAWQHKKFKENAETNNPEGWMKAKEKIRLYFQDECLLKKRRRLRNRGRHREGFGTKVPPSNSNSGTGNSEPQVKKPSSVTRPNDSARTPGEIPVFVPIIQERNRRERSDSPGSTNSTGHVESANLDSLDQHEGEGQLVGSNTNPTQRRTP